MSRAVGICLCRCHNTFLGTAKAAQQMGKFMKGVTYTRRAEHWSDVGCVEDTDAVEAASACDACLPKHCPALSTIPPRQPRVIRSAPRFNPTSDSQSTQADGDQGEGPEAL